VVLVEARVLRGDDGVLEVGGDLAEGDEGVALLVGLVVNPGLETALDMDSGGGWIDPVGGDEGERQKHPQRGKEQPRPLGEAQ